MTVPVAMMLPALRWKMSTSGAKSVGTPADPAFPMAASTEMMPTPRPLVALETLDPLEPLTMSSAVAWMPSAPGL